MRNTRTTEACLASAQVEEQNDPEEWCGANVRTDGSLSDDSEATNVMRTVGTKGKGQFRVDGKEIGVVSTDHQ